MCALFVLEDRPTKSSTRKAWNLQQMRGFSHRSEDAYTQWRAAKLTDVARQSAPTFVQVDDLGRPSIAEINAISNENRCWNLALFRCSGAPSEVLELEHSIGSFCTALGLTDLETQRSANASGIVILEVSNKADQKGFIPFSNRQLNWHTDGYYNYESPQRMIRSMMLYCVRDAQSGGSNRFFDHELAFIRLHDQNPAFTEALMHPEAMVIPANREPDGSTRPANAGPVFAVDIASGNLAMRYTRRKRNVEWRDDALTDSAVAALEDILDNDPHTFEIKLKPGEGVICNNVLHARTEFEDGSIEGRLFLRVRSYDRVINS